MQLLSIVCLRVSIRWRVVLLMFLARTIIAYLFIRNNRMLISDPHCHFLVLFYDSNGQDIFMVANEVRKDGFYKVKKRVPWIGLPVDRASFAQRLRCH